MSGFHHSYMIWKNLSKFYINLVACTWIIIGFLRNVFDVYLDRLKNSLNSNEGILIYSNEASPFGFNGGYYYVNMSFNF